MSLIAVQTHHVRSIGKNFKTKTYFC